MIKNYCERYDVYYNSETGSLLEQPCKNPKCEFCKDRPSKITKKICDACSIKCKEKKLLKRDKWLKI